MDWKLDCNAPLRLAPFAVGISRRPSNTILGAASAGTSGSVGQLGLTMPRRGSKLGRREVKSMEITRLALEEGGIAEAAYGALQHSSNEGSACTPEAAASEAANGSGTTAATLQPEGGAGVAVEQGGAPVTLPRRPS